MAESEVFGGSVGDAHLRKPEIDMEVVADGLAFPEGPIWMKDGSVILVEIKSGNVIRVTPDGKKQVIAHVGGGPNGAAIGPDGRVYVCNNGGFLWAEMEGLTFPGHQPEDYSGGRIEAVDIKTGKVEVLYTSCDGVALKGPNDIVFDETGGFYFTDLGKSRAHDVDHGAVYYARPDGSSIKTICYGLSHPNGIGLSPDGKTLYVAQSTERLLLAFDIVKPGEVAPPAGLVPGRPVVSFPGGQYLDSLAVTADGHVCCAALLNPCGIAMADPATGGIRNTFLPDVLTTNICFGGSDMRDAWVTLGTTGRLVKIRWDRPGLKLAYYA